MAAQRAPLSCTLLDLSGGPDEDVEDWISLCKPRMEIESEQWRPEERDQVKLARLRQHLRDDALDFFKSLSREDRKNVDLVLEKLKKRYHKEPENLQHRFYLACQELPQLRQGSTSVRDYVARTKKLQRKFLGLDTSGMGSEGFSIDEPVLAQFLEGLKNRDVARQTMAILVLWHPGEATKFETAVKIVLALEGTSEKKGRQS